MAITWIHYPNYKVKVEGVWQHKRLRVKQGAVWVDTIIKAAAMNTAVFNFVTRVLADLGYVESLSVTTGIVEFLEDEGLYADTEILICPEAGVKTRGTVPLYVTKSYDLSPNNNDAVQTTELNQPFLAGNIAPNERLGWKSLKTTATGLSHNTISFTTAEPWSFTVALKSNGHPDPSVYEYVNWPSLIGVRRDGLMYLRNDSLSPMGISVNNYKHQRGKINFLTVIGLGSTVKVYFNGVYVNQTTLDSNFSFESDITTNSFLGNKYYRRVQSGAMTLAQVEAEHAMLRSIYPEIESVQIGTQTWATSNLEMAATPMGNPINEIQLAAATERIINGGFDSDTIWTKETGWTIADGVATHADSVSSSLFINGILNTNKWYKVTYTVTSFTSGTGFKVLRGSTAAGLTRAAVGTYTEYIKQGGASRNGGIYAYANTVGSVDNVSFIELGWADSTELYNGLIAQGYTAENALKEVAWWCYYNNDPVNGATYGKLYNWYAAKLLQTDIDAYNAAYPSTPWGWKIPTDADFETLRTTIASNGWNYDGTTNLGSTTENKQGKALASDSLWAESAVEGSVGNTDYPDKRNISGFTALPGGRRTSGGSFSGTGYGFWWSSTESSADSVWTRYLTFNTIYVYRTSYGKGYGYSVRLLKS